MISIQTPDPDLNSARTSAAKITSQNQKYQAAPAGRIRSEAMARHLAEISKAVGEAAHAALVRDGAGWHRPGGRLTVPENVTLLRLPPYAPELNPMENVWECLRGNQLSMTVWRTYAAVLDACCNAWNSLMRDAQRITSITTRTWAQVKV